MIIQVVLFLLYVLINDSYKAGRLYFDFTLMYTGLGSLETIGIALCVEACLLGGTFLVHPALKLWSVLRGRTSPLLVDLLFSLLYAAFVFGSGFMVLVLVFSVPFPPYTTIVISVEHLRLCLKSYSFLRENCYKVLYPWNKDDDSGPAVLYAGQLEPKTSSFSQYLYFIFCPSLIYRDRYPRNPGPINVKNALIYFAQFITTIWYFTVLIRDFLLPETLRLEDLLGCYLKSLLAAFFIFLLVHTCVLHSYMNFVSEVMRFADRNFYQDWWCSTSFSMFYRKWNAVVHDWIHAYMFNDVKALSRGSGVVAVCTSIVVSAFVHEYLLSLALGFASPVLIFEFVVLGAIFYFLRPFRIRRVSNILVLLGLSVGGANLVFYYQVEWVARQLCPKEFTIPDFFLPRMFECYSKFNS